MKLIVSVLITGFALIHPVTASTGPITAERVRLSLHAPKTPNGQDPPKQLIVLLEASGPAYYKLDVQDRTVSAGRLIRGELPVGLAWDEMARIGRVPLTLSVIDSNQVSRHEFCLIFSPITNPVGVDTHPVQSEVNRDAVLDQGSPQISFHSQSDRRFERLLEEIRATPAPRRPYELVDAQIYNQISFSPINLLLYALSRLGRSLLAPKADPLTEITVRYSRRLETGQEWVAMRVSLINHPLPEARSGRCP